MTTMSEEIIPTSITTTLPSQDPTNLNPNSSLQKQEETVTKKEKKLSPPLFLKQRSSTHFIATTVALGVLVDLAGYGIITPVIPFRLKELGYDNIGEKVGWLVSSYALGLIVSTPFVAYLGSKFRNSRRVPLILALLAMAGGLILFMETNSYTTMIISRVLQGISGTGLWTVGLALITDSVPRERVGIVMGYVMIGFSVGSLIGPPVGGVLYERLGYRSVFIFALILVAIDLAMRLLMIEKNVALKWIEKGVIIEGFEAPGYIEKKRAVETDSSVEGEEKNTIDTDLEASTSTTSPPQIDTTASASSSSKTLTSSSSPSSPTEAKQPTVWSGLAILLTSGRPNSLFLLTMLNGFVLGGLLDTGMTLWLEQLYGLNSLGAGLCFIGAVAPSFVASPFAGWAADKYGAKGISSLGLIVSVPTYSLLIIQGPLPLFVCFLVLVGFSISFFLTPIIQDLSLVVELIPGLGSEHVYSMFNLVYSIGAFLGPIVGGQVIGALQIRKGWLTLCILSSALSLALVPFLIMFVGGRLEGGIMGLFKLENKKEKVEDEIMEKKVMV